MSQCNATFDLKINLGHIFHGPVIFLLLFFALKNILVLLAKCYSGALRCPATVLIIILKSHNVMHLKRRDITLLSPT